MIVGYQGSRRRSGRVPQMASKRRRWRPSAAGGSRMPPKAAKLRRWQADWQPSAADGGQAPPMAAERRRWQPSSADGSRAQCRRWPTWQAQCRRWRPAQPGQCEIKSNLIKLLQEKCGEEMKCDTNSGNCWSSSRRPQRWRCRTWTKIIETSRKGPQK
jgi:hypothetical protein